MKIKSFRVAGYKNLVKPVALDGLDKQSLIVIHGLNNVGKSNLLEALQLPFLLIALTERREAPLDREVPLPGEILKRGHVPTEWLTLGKPTPIEIGIVLSLSDAERQQHRLAEPAREVDLAFRIEVGLEEPTWRITRCRFADGVDASWRFPEMGAEEFSQFLEAHREELANKVPSKRARDPMKELSEAARPLAHAVLGMVKERFALLDLHRTSSGLRGRSILTDQLALSLYDAKESTDPREYLRWSAFVRVCGEFGDVLGGAEPVVTYDRHRNLATLHMQSPAGRLPAHLLGTGVQQLLAIIGRMLVSKADVVAIEEPETSVSMGLHARVRDALQRMTETDDGLSQVFLTSHSPWFDGPEDFIAVVATDDGPAVQWRKANEVAKFTQSEMTPPPAKTAPLSYVTGEGYVALPLFVREHLAVEHGGGVVFNTAPEGRITMLSTQTALAEFGESDDDAE